MNRNRTGKELHETGSGVATQAANKSQLDRFNVIDCQITAANIDALTEAVVAQIDSKNGGYVCFSNVHTVVASKTDSHLRNITNNSFISAADGKPLYFVGRLSGVSGAGHSPGPDFMGHLLAHGSGIRHFFYGSSQATLDALISNVSRNYPDAIIVGCHSPPFKDIKPDLVDHDAVELIMKTSPDVVWVGLGAPKQEYWMSAHTDSLKPAILMGVGAAFDFHAGTVSRAPKWMRKSGLEWLYRLIQEPTRLFNRYAVTNSLFLYYLAADYFMRLTTNCDDPDISSK